MKDCSVPRGTDKFHFLRGYDTWRLRVVHSFTSSVHLASIIYTRTAAVRVELTTLLNHRGGGRRP